MVSFTQSRRKRIEREGQQRASSPGSTSTVTTTSFKGVPIGRSSLHGGKPSEEVKTT
jgi:hypothetical protein